MKKYTHKFSLFYLALFLLMVIGIQMLLLMKVEDNQLAKNQEKTIMQLKKSFNSSKSVLDVQSVEIGKPLAILEVPAIKLTVPVYYGTTDTVLSEGTGLLEGTSDLDGGNGKHSVLTGHNGLSEKRLFTQLDELRKGDKFAITTQKGKRVYLIDTIKVIPAEELHVNANEYIKPNKNKEFVTLVTCTPRNINSHRLLVRGHYIKDKSNIRITMKAYLMRKLEKNLMTIIIVGFGLVTIFIFPVIRFHCIRR